jgi:hypothetical protein
MNQRQSNGERVSVAKPRRQGWVQKLVEAPVRKRRIQRGTEKEVVANTHKRHEERVRAILVPSERRGR